NVVTLVSGEDTIGTYVNQSRARQFAKSGQAVRQQGIDRNCRERVVSGRELLDQTDAIHNNIRFDLLEEVHEPVLVIYINSCLHLVGKGSIEMPSGADGTRRSINGVPAVVRKRPEHDVAEHASYT